MKTPVKTGTHGNTPKFFNTASVEDVTACLKAGANPKAQDEDGRTPLHHIARGNGNPSMVAALLQVRRRPQCANKTRLDSLAWSGLVRRQQHGNHQSRHHFYIDQSRRRSQRSGY